MELRAYWAMIRRRMWIVAPIVLVVALYATMQYYQLATTPGALKAYQSTLTMRIGLQATPQSSDQDYANYLTVSATLADALVMGSVLNSPEFTGEVSQKIQTNIEQVQQRYGANAELGDWQNPAAISGAISTLRTHNLVTVTVLWSHQAGAWAIADAIGEVSAEHMGNYLDYEIRSTPATTQNGSDHPRIAATVISQASEPVLVAGAAGNRPALLLALLFVACILAIALAFLMEYLDDRIRGKEEAEYLLQLSSYGEIPRPPVTKKGQSRHPTTM